MGFGLSKGLPSGAAVVKGLRGGGWQRTGLPERARLFIGSGNSHAVSAEVLERISFCGCCSVHWVELFTFRAAKCVRWL